MMKDPSKAAIARDCQGFRVSGVCGYCNNNFPELREFHTRSPTGHDDDDCTSTPNCSLLCFLYPSNSCVFLSLKHNYIHRTQNTPTHTKGHEIKDNFSIRSVQHMFIHSDYLRVCLAEALRPLEQCLDHRAEVSNNLDTLREACILRR